MASSYNLDKIIYTIPQDFLGENSLVPPVVYHNYHNDKAVHRSQIQLTYHLVSFLQMGTKVVEVAPSVCTIEEGELLLLQAGHCLMTETLAGNAQYHSCLLLFEPTVLDQFLYRHQIQVPLETTKPSHQVMTYDPYLRNFVESLQLLPTQSATLLTHKLEELLLYWYEQHGAAFFAFWQQRPSPEEQLLVGVTQRAIKSLLTVEEMAFLCHMSPSTFKRKFAKHYGDSPQHWLREQRLQHAYWLLKEKQQRPQAIFLEAGFNHPSSFTQAFKKRFGQLPSEVGQC